MGGELGLTRHLFSSCSPHQSQEEDKGESDLQAGLQLWGKGTYLLCTPRSMVHGGE